MPGRVVSGAAASVGQGGGAALGSSSDVGEINVVGYDGKTYGGGGGGASNGGSQLARNGGSGAAGIVIVELYS
jgi:hypothetical protein